MPTRSAARSGRRTGGPRKRHDQVFDDQNCTGDRRQGGIYNFVTKRGAALARTPRLRGPRSRRARRSPGIPSCICRVILDRRVYSVATTTTCSRRTPARRDHPERTHGARSSKGHPAARSEYLRGQVKLPRRRKVRATTHRATRCSSVTSAAPHIPVSEIGNTSASRT